MEWGVKCRICGATWNGGSANNLPEHVDVRVLAYVDDEEPGAPTSDPTADARAAEAKRLASGRSSAQGIGIAFGDYLEMLGILSELNDFDRGLFSDENDRIALDAASVEELTEVLRDFLPDCWDPMVWRGYPAPDYCEFPEQDVCARCQAQGKRRPRFRPPRP